MLARISRWLLAVVLAVGVCRAGVARGQKLEAPLQLASIEWLVADSDFIVRGVVVDVAGDQNWNIVTLDVLDTWKGADARRLKSSCTNSTREKRHWPRRNRRNANFSGFSNARVRAFPVRRRTAKKCWLGTRRTCMRRFCRVGQGAGADQPSRSAPADSRKPGKANHLRS